MEDKFLLAMLSLSNCQMLAACLDNLCLCQNMCNFAVPFHKEGHTECLEKWEQVKVTPTVCVRRAERDGRGP